MLEQNIETLTAAVVDLTAALKAHREAAAVTAAPAADKPAPKRTSKKKDAPEAADEPTPSTIKTEAQTEPNPEPAAESGAEAMVAIGAVKSAIISVTTHTELGKSHAVGILKSFGVERVSELDPSKYDEVVAACVAARAAA